MSFIRNRIIDIPKVGRYEILLPEPPSKEKILNWELSKEDQYWRPTKIPSDFDYLSKEDQLSFIRQELDRRENGFFFFNNGNIEYITGVHYFYLCYWNLDIGLPYFCDADRDFFYVWDACVQSPNSYGLLDTENRRGGKTSRGICIVYEYVSRKFNTRGGIQSKTNSDSKDVFLKLIKSWKRLHPIWKPTDTGENNPKSELRFEEPRTRSTKNIKRIYKDVLNSMIDYKPAVEEAYDGTKLQRLYNDETGKTIEVNVYTRWQIQKFCLRQGMDIIGKSIHTTTVEEMERKGGAIYKKLWDESDPQKIGADGRTTSGLWRYFKPAYYGLEGYIDKYGYSVVDDPKEPVMGNNGKWIKEGAKTALLKEREGKTGQALYDLIRKQPFNIDEAFIISDKSEIYPAYKIYEQRNYNETIYEPLYKIGNLEWTGENQVAFFENPNGRWKIAWEPPQELRNKTEIRRNGIAPGNTDMGLIGVDPFDHKTTVDNRRSNAAMYLFRVFNPMEPLRSGNFVLEYINRPPIPEMLYDDVLRTCVYYGVEMLSESQKPGLINYFNLRGYHNYVKKTNLADLTKNGADKLVDGISTSGDYTRESLMNHSVTYVYENIGKLSAESQIKRGINNIGDYHGYCPFDELLKQWLEFDVNKWTEYDAVVASSIAILGTKNLRGIRKKKREFNMDDWFPPRK